MNATEEYETVNSLLRMIGEGEIPEPATGTDREKVEHLLAVYTERLKEKVSKYKSLPDDSLIPDAMLAYLRSQLKESEQSL